MQQKKKLAKLCQNENKSKALTLISRVSLTVLPLCDQVNVGGGKPETSHSNFIFCPALAITLESGIIKAGDSVGSIAGKVQVSEL